MMNCRIPGSLIPFVVILSSSALAQTTHVVPAGSGLQTSGGDAQFLALADTQGGVRCMQVLTPAGLGFNARTITEIALRHSAFFVQGWATVHQFRVSMGHTGFAPEALPNQFAAVPSAPMTIVFQGPIQLPDSTSQQVPRPWSVVLPLQSSFAHDASLGNLVVEIESSYLSGGMQSWAADAVSQTPGGAGHQILGSGCDGLSAQFLGSPDTMVPGGSMSFALSQMPALNMTGGAMLGNVGFPGSPGNPGAGFPLDLGFMGSPGCVLQFSPLLEQPAAVSGVQFTATGVATWAIPSLPFLSGLSFDHQVYLIEPASLGGNVRLSTAHRVRIGSSAPVPALVGQLIGNAGDSIGTSPTNPGGWVMRLTTQ
jgi:hypothetical protein